MLEFTIFPQHNKYLVTDADNNVVYTLKKKWRGGWAILDRNRYELYVLGEASQERHPVYQLLLNGKPCGKGTGSSKKRAEQAAAAAAIDALFPGEL